MSKEEIIKKLGLENSDPLTQQALLQQVSNSVSTRILNKLTELLSDEDLDKISSLIDTGNDVEVENYIMSKVPNFDIFKSQIEEETIDEIANNATSITEKAKESLSENLAE
jgi:hypothetical protein